MKKTITKIITGVLSYLFKYRPYISTWIACCIGVGIYESIKNHRIESLIACALFAFIPIIIKRILLIISRISNHNRYDDESLGIAPKGRFMNYMDNYIKKQAYKRRYLPRTSISQSQLTISVPSEQQKTFHRNIHLANMTISDLASLILYLFTHTSLAGRDSDFLLIRKAVQISTHTSLAGRDHASRAVFQRSRIFLLTRPSRDVTTSPHG